MKYVIDTNIFIRFFTKDPGEYQDKAKRIIEKLNSGQIEGYICESVFTEVFYVLKRVYRWPKDEIVEAMKGILSLKGISLADKDIFTKSLEIYSRYSALDIEDCIEITYALTNGFAILTFDKGMDEVAGLQRLETIE